MIGTMLSDPVFQGGVFGSLVGTLALLLVLRTQVTTHPMAVARGTRLVVALGILSVLVVSGWSGWQTLSGQQGHAPASLPASSTSPTATPMADPTEEPTPTPTPHLAHSITEVLTAFCQEITRTKVSCYAERYLFPTGCA